MRGQQAEYGSIVYNRAEVHLNTIGDLIEVVRETDVTRESLITAYNTTYKIVEWSNNSDKGGL